jgi:3-dehydroquinate synthase
VLNYGHTIGHAIEVGEKFSVLHGEAVGLGMLAEAQWAEAQGLGEGVVQPLTALLSAMNMPVDWRRATLQVEALRCDKKRRGDSVMLPVVPRPGSVRLHAVSLDKLVAFATDGTRP